MKDKKFKKLSRSELLEMLLEQTKEVKRLTKELEIANKALENRKIMLDNTGSIAEASLKMSSIFEDAQKAANLYLANIKLIEDEAWKKAKDIIAQAYHEGTQDNNE